MSEQAVETDVLRRRIEHEIKRLQMLTRVNAYFTQTSELVKRRVWLERLLEGSK